MIDTSELCRRRLIIACSSAILDSKHTHFWRGINYCVQKRVTECHAKLHVTLSKHQNEMNTIKVEEHNNKSVGRNVPMAKCHKAITKEQFSIARPQNKMTEVQFVMFQ